MTNASSTQKRGFIRNERRQDFGVLSLAVLLLFILRCPILTAQDQVSDNTSRFESSQSIDSVPRSVFLATQKLDVPTRQLSEELLLKALDGEAFYTLVGQLKPVSEGFWSGYFSVDPPDLSEIERVRSALQSWNVPGMFFSDVLVYESMQDGQRYASAYVVHVPSLKKLIAQKNEFFARWGISDNTPPGQVMMTIERARQPEDRWRGFGLVFGYPEYAVDFFVSAGMHQRSTGEFVERDFRQIATFSGRSGRFVYAVPKLSRLRSEDLTLQRKAAVLLSEYKKLRPQYAVPTKMPSELLKEWMDDGSGNCHPDHLLAKLPTRTETELDAEIASWSTPEARPPEVKFNHLYLVLSQSEFDAIRSSDFLINRFAASDQGFPKFLPVDAQSQSIYLRGRETYLELLGPDNKFREPVGKLGVGWSVEKVGELDAIQKLLAERSSESFTRVLNQWDFDREGAPVPWYHTLFRKQTSAGDAVWWFSETHVDFLPSLYPSKAKDGERIARRDFLEPRFDSTRILKNLTNFAIHLSLDAARSLRSDLEQVGWRSEEFDSRTWILRGPDFRLMIFVKPKGTITRLNSIGFDTNPDKDLQVQQTIGRKIDIRFDGSQSGWIEFHE